MSSKLSFERKFFSTVSIGAMFAMLGCAGAYDPAGTLEDDETETVPDDPDFLRCRASDRLGRSEWYIPSAIRQKLQYYPEFAVTVGLASVSTCREARVFVERYEAYLESYPNFDADQPFELGASALPAPPPPFNESEVYVTKLVGGALSSRGPIVRISATEAVPGDEESCTGTFIAKNWILTAAHCMQQTRGVHAWYSWNIHWYDNGQPVGTTSFTDRSVLQYIDNRYTGTREISAPYDVGLLYISGSHDGALPPGPNGSSPGNGHFMRLATAGFPTSTAEVWGAGMPDMRMRAVPATQFAFPSSQPDKKDFETIVQLTEPYVCQGDSGGPIVDYYPIPDQENPNVTVSEPAVVATFRAGHGKPFPDNRCWMVDSEWVRWARTSVEIGWIQARMREWNGDRFSCKLEGAPGVQKAKRCWGDPCRSDTDCKAGETCWNSGEYLTICSVCPSGGCDCVFGQCLPTP